MTSDLADPLMPKDVHYCPQRGGSLERHNKRQGHLLSTVAREAHDVVGDLVEGFLALRIPVRGRYKRTFISTTQFIECPVTYWAIAISALKSRER
ncbi:unnamed protein product, partial [Iphiclides podalirius]